MATTAKPGITLLVNGQDVQLKLDSLSLENGAEFELVHPVNLGTAGDLAAFIGDNFGVEDAAQTVTGAINGLPEPLDAMARRLVDLDVSIEEFRVSVPPTNSSKDTTFAVGLSGTWPFKPDDAANSGPIELIGGSGADAEPVLAVKGLYLFIERTDESAQEPVPTPVPTPEPTPGPTPV